MSKKVLSVLLAMVMLACVVSIGVYAEDEGFDFEVSASFNVQSNMSLSALSIGDIGGVGVTLKANEAKIGALDDGSTDFTFSVLSIEAVEPRENDKRYDFLTDPDGFKTVFGEKTPLDAYGEPVIDTETGNPAVAKFDGTTVFARIAIHFNSSKVFGAFDWTATLSGFAAPPDIGLSLDALNSVGIPTTLTSEGTYDEFPTVASAATLSATVRNTYTDDEKFDASGIALDVTLSNGESGTVSHGKNADNLLTFKPSAEKRLTVDTAEVVTEFMGQPVIYTPITVSHATTMLPVQLSSKLGNEMSGFGYHATVCEGCGITVTTPEACIPDENWVSNNDATFTKDGTETCHCTVCGGECTRLAYGSADYNRTFSSYHFLRVIFDYIAVLLRGLTILQF